MKNHNNKSIQNIASDLQNTQTIEFAALLVVHTLQTVFSLVFSRSNGLHIQKKQLIAQSSHAVVTTSFSKHSYKLNGENAAIPYYIIHRLIHSSNSWRRKFFMQQSRFQYSSHEALYSMKINKCLQKFLDRLHAKIQGL